MLLRQSLTERSHAGLRRNLAAICATLDSGLTATNPKADPSTAKRESPDTLRCGGLGFDQASEVRERATAFARRELRRRQRK